ncbi:MAG: AMP-binding protein [Sneathiellaceae bacterium]
MQTTGNRAPVANAVPPLAERRRALAARHPRWRQETLDRAIARTAAEHPDRPFVITDDGALGYADAMAQAETFARGLQARGIGAGDRVALVMGNYPVFVPLALAVWRLGAALIPVNFAFRTEELGYVIEQSRCRALITMTAFRGLDYLAMLDALSPGWEGGATARFPDLQLVACFDTGQGAPRKGLVMVEDLQDAGAAGSAPLPENPAGPDDPAVVMYTSGTTGLPKGVLQSHDNLLRCGYASALHRGFEDGRKILFALPLYHAFGLVMGVLSCFWVGGAVVPQLAFDPLETLKAIQAHRVSEAMFVPTMAMAVIEHPQVGEFDLSSLFACLSGAAATPAWVWRRMAEGLGLTELATGYGMTELSGAIVMTDPDGPLDLMEAVVGRIVDGGVAGLPALGGLVAEYRTCDPFTGAALPEGSEGELICRSPLATSGYFALPEQTAALFLELPGEGRWLRSGDLGRVRPDGFLEITGRSKELYKSGGELVAPKEVEAVLIAHDAVAQAYVIGLPDDRWGEVGAAWVVPTAPDAVTEDALIDWCRPRLAKFKWPRHVLFTTAAALPMTPTGKVQKFELIRQAQAKLAAAPATAQG